MKKVSLFLLGIILMMAFETAADIAYINAAIYDGEQFSDADALLVRDGRFFKVGSQDEIKVLLAPHDEIIDLKGNRLMPGFIEAHAHLLGLGQSKVNLDLRNKEPSEIIELLKKQAKAQPPAMWIVGRNWDQNIWKDKSFPTALMLKDVSKTHPIYLRRVDGHAAWVNDIALKRAQLNNLTKNPSGGEIVRDARGFATGVLVDNAMALVSTLLDKPSVKELSHFLELAEDEALSVGITSLHDAGASRATLDLYRERALKKKLKLRIYAMIDGDDQKLVDEYLQKGPQTVNDHLSIRSIKYFADGALGSRGALLIEDYSDKQGFRGLALMTEEQLTIKTILALKHGFQIATHAIGDSANRLVLGAYEAALKIVPSGDARLRIEHAQLIDPSDHHRFKELNVIASMQPTHCTSDMAWVPERIGVHRLKGRAYAWHSLLQNGVRLVFGSDAPVEPINPILGLHAAVTRQKAEEKNSEIFMPEERLTLKDAMAAFYKNAAFAEFAEMKKGRIAEGFLADFVVFDKDILKAPKAAFLAAKPLMTVVGGRAVYKRPA